MPNYNYRSNDYMRRGQCQRSIMPLSQKMECDYSVHVDDTTEKCCAHDLLGGLPIAMAYVPWQEFKNLYPAEKGLCRGTIFEELDKPFEGKGGCCK